MRPLAEGFVALLGVAALHHAKGRVGERGRAVLLHDAHTRADEPPAGPAFRAARLDDFAFGVDRVAGDDRALDRQFHVQKRKAGVRGTRCS